MIDEKEANVQFVEQLWQEFEERLADNDRLGALKIIELTKNHGFEVAASSMELTLEDAELTNKYGDHSL